MSGVLEDLQDQMQWQTQVIHRILKVQVGTAQHEALVPRDTHASCRDDAQ